MNSIETRNLHKSFGSVAAITDISFQVDESEIFGFLGPNGAGKSTTMMILTTLLKPTSGQALVSGYDVAASPKKVRENIGYVQQETTVDEYLTGRENLFLQARLNHIDKNVASSRIDDILELIELTDKQNDAVITYSGGMRKRLDIAGGLLHRPKILFLDEPTVGLDIQTRRKIWQYIKRIHDEYNTSIFLSTHYMEEADELCSKVGIIDHGKIQVIDTPKSMKSNLGQEIIHLIVDPLMHDNSNKNISSTASLQQKIQKINDVKNIEIQNEKITVFTANGEQVIPKIFQISVDHNIRIKSISLTKPTLDDVFISYTGHQLRDDETATGSRTASNFNRRREHAKLRRLQSS